MKKNQFLFLLVALGLASCSKTEESTFPVGAVVINELMPSNASTAADNYGEYDDWAELYNTTDAAIDLGGFYITDNFEEPTKYQFPAGTSIAAKSYLIVWLDSDAEQSGLHTSFKLSATGEELLLSDTEENELDKVEFGASTGEVSYARSPNGTGGFVWGVPSFNASN